MDPVVSICHLGMMKSVVWEKKQRRFEVKEEIRQCRFQATAILQGDGLSW